MQVSSDTVALVGGCTRLATDDLVLRRAQRLLTSSASDSSHPGFAGARAYTVLSCTERSGRSIAQFWSIHGMGHYWSGGDAMRAGRPSADDKCHQSVAVESRVCQGAAVTRLARPATEATDGLGGDALPAQAARVVRHAELAVLAFTVVLALVEVDRIAVLYGARNIVIAAVATAVWLPLHIWHLRYGLRGERPPRSLATLAVIAVVQLTTLALIGPAWSFMLATLATSSLIVLRPRWALVMLAACVVAPVPAAILHPQYTLANGSNDAYLMVSVAFRSCLQFSLVWLVACARELAASRAVLTREAAEREHARLETSMREMLERDLVRLAAEARHARAQVLGPGVAAALVALDRVLAVATAATDELRRVASEARAPAVRDAAAELERAAARTRTPVGRGLTVRGAWRYFVATNAMVLRAGSDIRPGGCPRCMADARGGALDRDGGGWLGLLLHGGDHRSRRGRPVRLGPPHHLARSARGGARGAGAVRGRCRAAEGVG